MLITPLPLGAPEFEIFERSERTFFSTSRVVVQARLLLDGSAILMTELTPQERSTLSYIVSKPGVWVRNSSGDETIARLFELKLITCLSDPTRPLRKVGATARGHLEARNGDFTIGERCTIRIGKHIYPDLPHQHGTFSAVILGPLADGRGYVIRVDEPSCAWHGWVVDAEHGVLGKITR